MRHPRGQVPRSGFLTGSDLWGSLIEKELEVSGTYLVSGDTIIPMDDEDTTLIMTEQKKKSSYGRRVCDFEVTDPLFRSANESTPEVSLCVKTNYPRGVPLRYTSHGCRPLG